MNASKSILVIACGALAREIIAILGASQLTHVDVQCVPAIYHNRPEKIAPAVRKLLETHQAHYEKTFIAFADCGTQGALEQVCHDHNVEMIQGPHCYAFYEGQDTFSAHDEIDCFYLTDFLVRHFETFIWLPLGLDTHPELLDMYFTHYKTLVYQAQTQDPNLTALAQTCATRLGLAFERRYTGYGELESDIHKHSYEDEK